MFLFCDDLRAEMARQQLCVRLGVFFEIAVAAIGHGVTVVDAVAIRPGALTGRTNELTGVGSQRRVGRGRRCSRRFLVGRR